MLTRSQSLPEDPEELRSFTAQLPADVKAQAILIGKLRPRLAARMKLPDIEHKDNPKRRPVPDHIPRMDAELTPGADAGADCDGCPRAGPLGPCAGHATDQGLWQIPACSCHPPWPRPLPGRQDHQGR
jgi:hypothetical protein